MTHIGHTHCQKIVLEGQCGRLDGGGDAVDVRSGEAEHCRLASGVILGSDDGLNGDRELQRQRTGSIDGSSLVRVLIH